MYTSWLKPDAPRTMDEKNPMSEYAQGDRPGPPYRFEGDRMPCETEQPVTYETARNCPMQQYFPEEPALPKCARCGMRTEREEQQWPQRAEDVMFGNETMETMPRGAVDERWNDQSFFRARDADVRPGVLFGGKDDQMNSTPMNYFNTQEMRAEEERGSAYMRDDTLHPEMAFWGANDRMDAQRPYENTGFMNDGIMPEGCCNEEDESGLIPYALSDADLRPSTEMAQMQTPAKETQISKEFAQTETDNLKSMPQRVERKPAPQAADIRPKMKNNRVAQQEELARPCKEISEKKEKQECVAEKSYSAPTRYCPRIKNETKN